MTATGVTRARTILRQRLAADVVALPVVWGIFLAGVALLVGAVALLGDGGIEISGWEQASQIPRWYAGGVGVYLTAVYLPLYVAHGYTRRDFASQLPPFVGAFATAFAALMTLGYGVETLGYRAFGWTQEVTGTHLYEAPTQYPLIFAEFLMVGLVWTIGGAILGAAFYRGPRPGVALLPVALAMVALVEAASGAATVGWIGEAGLELIAALVESGSPAVAALVTAALCALGLGLLWPLIRDLPIRSKSA